MALLPVRFFSADAANLYLISLIAPARKETHVERPVGRQLACGDHPRSTPGQRGSSLVRSVVSRKRDGAVKTQREKAEEKRQVKLDLVREQIQNGTLVIRHMTEEERRRNLARITPPKRPGDDTYG